VFERSGEDDPDEERFLRGIWEEGDDRGLVLETLKDGAPLRRFAARERAAFAALGRGF
jgi:hypothetical protein